MTPTINGLKFPPQLAALILKILSEQGVNKTQLLKGTNINRAFLEHENDYVSYKQMLTLIENSLALTTTPELGLLVGCRENVGTWGVLGHAIMSCATYHQGFELGIRYHLAAPSMMLLDFQEEACSIKIKMTSPCSLGSMLPFCVEETVAGLSAVGSTLVGKDIKPLALSFTYSKPDYSAEYENLFDCPIAFDQPANIILMAAPDKTPLLYSDPITAKICFKYLKELFIKHQNIDVLELELRRILLRTPKEFPDMEAVAAELGMHSRTLRRKLNSLGTSFRYIMNDVRKQLALEYLQTSSLHLEDIAELLGYTELSNFRRAFKLWTGKLPSFYRITK